MSGERLYTSIPTTTTSNQQTVLQDLPENLEETLRQYYMHSDVCSRFKYVLWCCIRSVLKNGYYIEKEKYDYNRMSVERPWFYYFS